ncbi:hypothetical protein ACFOFO_03285 [Undibacterium arcticum]|uniref:Uncharacterized protein n=2 Tax=Undibacterium arcticum TaxID=1762892 RepID=A0ABV7EYZ7_9BURK
MVAPGLVEMKGAAEEAAAKILGRTDSLAECVPTVFSASPNFGRQEASHFGALFAYFGDLSAASDALYIGTARKRCEA